MRKGVEFFHCHRVDFVELGGNEKDGTGHQFPVFIVDRHSIGQKLIEERNSEEESASAEVEVVLGAEEPLDGSVSLSQGVGELAGDYFFGGGAALGELFLEGDELEVWDAEVSCYHFLNF